MNADKLKEYGIGFGVIFIQLTLFRHLKIYNMQPDLIIIYLLWVATKKDRTSAIILAAVLGFTQDALLDLWGLNMFSKTLLIFAGYNFIPKSSNVRLLAGQVFLIVLIACLIHNLIFLGLNAAVEIYSAEFLFWSQWLGSSLYTAVVAFFLYLFRTR